MIVKTMNAQPYIDASESSSPVALLGDSVIIRPVANEAEMSMVHRLTHDCYVSKGYADPQANGQLNHYPEFSPSAETTVFVAIRAGAIIGSISITVDSPKGLTVDKDFKKECDGMRTAGRRLAVAWRLVMQQSSNPSRQILLQLMIETAKRATDLGSDTWLFTVHPRHASIYKRLLGMHEVSRKQETAGLRAAPAVFLRCDFETLSNKFRRMAQIPQLAAA